MLIDYNDQENYNKPLWCVYGSECFPSMFCCKIIYNAEFGPIVWGYSVYRRSPGFRTLGQNVNIWINNLKKKYGWSMFEFYDQHSDAIHRVTDLTNPRISS